VIEEAIIQRLLATSEVATIVGTRVFPGSKPQAAPLPAIVFNKISGAPLYDDKGEVGLDENRLQIDCWAATYSAAKGLARAVRESLSAYFGTSESVESLYCALDMERDLREGGGNAAEYLYRTSMDFLILNRS
jgi:hypothetical protein